MTEQERKAEEALWSLRPPYTGGSIDYDLLYRHGHKQYTIEERVAEIYAATRSQSDAANFLARCRDDRLYFADNCADQLNPRARNLMDSAKAVSKKTPFLSFLRQREASLYMEYARKSGQDLVFLKARNVGLSWRKEIDIAHNWLFGQDYSNLSGSYNDDLVDPGGEGDMSALFPKFDYLLSRLPLGQLMLPQGYLGKDGKPAQPWSVKMQRVNPVNGNSMIGKAMGKDFGAGMRADDALFDELSRCVWQEEAWTSCGQTVNSRQAIFTPQGKDFAWGLSFPEEYKNLSGKSFVESPLVFRVDWRDIGFFNKFFLMDTFVDLDPIPWRSADEFRAWLRSMAHNIVRNPDSGKEDDYDGSYHGYAPVPMEINGREIDCDMPEGMGYHDKDGNISFYEHRKPLERLPNRAISVIYPWRIIEGFRYDEVKSAQELDISFDEAKEGRVYAVQMKSTVRTRGLVRNPSWPLYCGVDPGRSSGNAFFVFWVQWNPDLRRYECLKELTMEGKSAYYFIPFLTGKDSDLHHAEDEGLKDTDKDYELYELMRSNAWRPNAVFCDPGYTSAKTAGAKDSIENIWLQAGIPVRLSHKHRDFPTRIGAARKVLRYTAIDTAGCPKLNTGLSQIAWPKRNPNSQVSTVGNGYVHHPQFSHACAAFEYFACFNPHEFDQQEYQKDAPERRYQQTRADERGNQRGRYFPPHDVPLRGGGRGY